MPQPPTTLRVAAVQDAPVFLDRDASIEKACRLIADAASQNAGLVVFPEGFIPAYPDWVWVVPGGNKKLLNDLYTRLWNNAITIPDQSTARLCTAAKESGIYVVIGISERNTESSGASLYNTLLYINPSGEIIGRHRKLVPTGSERLVWAQGGSTTLDAFPTPYGPIGGLICWENYMPLARYHMYRQGVRVYLAATWESSELWLAGMRHIAKEGGMFVIDCCMALKMSDIPDSEEFKKLYPVQKTWINPGRSCIVNPAGQFLAGPVENEQLILYADLDLNLIASAKWILDTAGHYDRPDVFDFKIRSNE